MRSGKLTKRELDELGRDIVAAGRPADREIDRIVSSPRLYEGVLAKIAQAQQPVRERKSSRSIWKPAASAAMAVVLMSIPLLAYLKYADRKTPVAWVPQPDMSVPAGKTLRTGGNDRPEPPAADEPVSGVQPKAVRAAFAVRTAGSEPAPVPRARKSRPEPAADQIAVFHPIGASDKVEDAALDDRVVRVELPRAALFAMGIDVPLENATRSVKADLLVGADGSPRAIRIVE